MALISSNRPQGGAANEESEGAQSSRRGGDKPRVLLTTPCKVVLYVPGLGIRPFHFINTFEGGRPQQVKIILPAHRFDCDTKRGLHPRA